MGKVSLVVFSILLGLVAVAYLLTDVPKAAGAYNRNHAAALRAKLPMSDAELERMRAVPDADNAALTLGPVIQDLVTIRKADTFNYNDTVEDVARKAWPKLEADLPVIERASRQSTFSLKVSIQSGEQHPYYDPSPYRDLFKILDGRLHLSAKAGNLDETRRLAGISARLTALIGNEPSQEFFLMRMTAGILVRRGLQTVLNLRGQNAAYRKIVADAATTMDTPFDLRPMLREHYWEATNYVLDSLQPKRGSFDAPSSPARFIPSFERASLSRVDEFYAYAVSNYPVDLWDDEALHEHFFKLQSLQNPNEISMTIVTFVTSLLDDIDKPIRRYRAETNVLQQAVRALDGADLNNGLPLQDRHRLDSDGSPLRVRKTPDGWIIYSIGHNLTDDDGVFDSKAGKDDFAVRIPTRLKWGQ